MSDKYLIIRDSAANNGGIRTLNSQIQVCPFFDPIGNLNMNGLNIIGNSSSATQVALTSDNTNGTYFIPFSKTASTTSNSLYIDNNISGNLTYNPSTGEFLSSSFAATITNGTFFLGFLRHNYK